MNNPLNTNNNLINDLINNTNEQQRASYSSPKLKALKRARREEEQLNDIKKYLLIKSTNNTNEGEDEEEEHDERFKVLARDFLLKCKLILDQESFDKLIETLVDVHRTPNDIIEEVLHLIGNNNNNNDLKERFSVFLVQENALKHNLFMKTHVYERVFHLFDMLDTFTPNKSSFKRLLQLIISNCSKNFNLNNNSNHVLKECQRKQQEQILNDVKIKVKTFSKNNQLVSNELDSLFNQISSHEEPQYEKISLLDNSANEHACDTRFEKIDLIKCDLNSFLHDNGTKKCACSCHTTNKNTLDANTSHCFGCAICLAKGKLLLKNDCKKGVPLSCRFKTI